MVDKASFPEVVQKIQDKALSEADIAQYFIVTPDPLRPMNFKIQVNADNVDIRGLERLARNADALLASPVISEGTGVRDLTAAKPRYIVAEGDSWFRLPHFLGIPRTMIDVLQQADKTDTIVNLAHWGDTLGEMLQTGEFWHYVDAGYDLLLFSAGGNDVLGGGNLAQYLNLLDPDHEAESDAPYYIRPKFYSDLAIVVANLELGLIKPLAARHVKTRIVMHGYDYAVPFPDGPWIGGPMASVGLDVRHYKPLCCAIVRRMIDAYNSALAALGAKYPDVFHYLDLRGTVGDNGWWIEMHAKDAGAQAYEAKLKAKIDTIAPVPFLAAKQQLFAPVALPGRAA